MLLTLGRVVVPLSVYGVVALTKLWADAFDSHVWLIICATVLFPLAEAVSEASARAWAELYVTRLAVAVSVLCGAAVLAVTLILADMASGHPASMAEAAQAAIIGIGVGVGVRWSFLASFKRHSQARSSHSIRLVLSSSIAAIVLLLPTGLDPVAPGIYVASVGVGFFVHFVWRRWDERVSSCQWVGRSLSTPLTDTSTKANRPVETIAVSHMAERRAGQLNKLLDENERTPTSGLVFIRALLLRQEGRYADSNSVVERANFPNGPASDELAPFFDLLVGLNLRDLGQYMEGAAALERARQLAPQCGLVGVAHGLSLLEELPLPGHAGWADAHGARQRAAESIMSVLGTGLTSGYSGLFGPVAARALPLARTTSSELFAYLTLKVGFVSSAQMLLERCIDESSDSPSLFLRLGECHLASEALAKASGREDRADRYRRAARLCLYVASRLDDADGHIRRRARGLLEERFGLAPALRPAPGTN